MKGCDIAAYMGQSWSHLHLESSNFLAIGDTGKADHCQSWDVSEHRWLRWLYWIFDTRPHHRNHQRERQSQWCAAWTGPGPRAPSGCWVKWLAPKKINAPETFFLMADESQPGRTVTGTRSWSVVLFKYAPDNIFIDVNSKSFVDFLVSLQKTYPPKCTHAGGQQKRMLVHRGQWLSMAVLRLYVFSIGQTQQFKMSDRLVIFIVRLVLLRLSDELCNPV